MPEVECGFPDQNQLVKFGPTLWVEIGFDSKYKPERNGRPNLPQTQHPALVDTGATESCIDSTLATVLKLPIVDRQWVSGIHGKDEVNVHVAQIYVPSLKFTTYGRFCGVHLSAGGQPHQALIGRTFLRSFTLVYDGTAGTVTVSNAPG